MDDSLIGVQTVLAVDLDGDGDKDVLAAGGSNSNWYEYQSDGTFAVRSIAVAAGGFRGVSVGDLDGDGDLDVVNGWFDNDSDHLAATLLLNDCMEHRRLWTGSLREAISCANTTPYADTIDFDFDTSGQHTISLLSPLPVITDPVTIDGTTATGFIGSPLVAIDGSLAGSGADGLVIEAAGTSVRGIVINRIRPTWNRLDGGADNATRQLYRIVA